MMKIQWKPNARNTRTMSTKEHILDEAKRMRVRIRDDNAERLFQVQSDKCVCEEFHRDCLFSLSPPYTQCWQPNRSAKLNLILVLFL